MSDDEPFKGRVLVLGGRGMLGRAVAVAARDAGYQTWAPDSGYDIADYDVMHTIYSQLSPHYVVNCAGIIPERATYLKQNYHHVRANALGPWVVRAAFTNSKVIHVSTDCVFSGNQPGMRRVTDVMDATDLYGRTKAMGECPGNINVRTSFIGFRHGLLRWFLDQDDNATIYGRVNALWSGSTVYEVAEALVLMFQLEHNEGTFHLAASAITKYDLLIDLKKLFNKRVNIVEDDTIAIYRGLTPTISLSRDLDRLTKALQKEAVRA